MRTPFLIAALMLSDPAHAGAWLREQGSGFLSFGSTIDELGRSTGSAYAEYGLRPKLTLGAKVDVDMTAGQIGDGSAYVFARKPIPTGERAYKLAYELGIGGTIEQDPSALLRTGLSYGRGITAWDHSGWIAIDGALEWVESDSSVTAKLDATMGLTLNDRFKVMFQVFYSQTETEATTTLAPSLIWTPKPDKNRSYQLGVEAKEGVLGLKLGVWHSF
ncbi:hypothetical protein [Tateyamaria sp.]|uniref:hypothetical protein n=1 Tax=Tateyamaria sp. TaxID=1929288 RepID=UPI00329F5EA2